MCTIISEIFQDKSVVPVDFEGEMSQSLKRTQPYVVVKTPPFV